jgi:hypothetical protein
MVRRCCRPGEQTYPYYYYYGCARNGVNVQQTLATTAVAPKYTSQICVERAPPVLAESNESPEPSRSLALQVLPLTCWEGLPPSAAQETS